jgi:hypothetical protein
MLLVRGGPWLLALTLFACGDDSDTSLGGSPAVGGGGDSSGGAVSGGGGSGAEGGGLSNIVVAATDASITLDFDVAITGSGTSFVGDIDVQGATGTAVLDGETFSVLAYERQPFAEYVLYQMLAVSTDRWFVVWAYCVGTDLTYFYFEGTDGTALDYESASGVCAEAPGPIEVEVQFPSVDMPIPNLYEGFTIDGPAVQVPSGAPGTVDLGVVHTVLPFEAVDCTVDCGAPGWRELHTLLWDQVSGRVCFGIFYLFEDDPEILLAYSLTLPDLSDPAGDVALPAEWTFTP